MKTSRNTSRLFWIVLDQEAYDRVLENDYILLRFVQGLNHYNKKDAQEVKEKFEEIYKDKYYILKIQDEYRLEYEEVEDD